MGRSGRVHNDDDDDDRQDTLPKLISAPTDFFSCFLAGKIESCFDPGLEQSKSNVKGQCNLWRNAKKAEMGWIFSQALVYLLLTPLDVHSC